MAIANPTTLRTINGETIEICLGPPAEISSFFVFSMHKAGSTLLNCVMADICSSLGIPVFEPEIEEYNNGVILGSLDKSVLSLFSEKGFCYGGFRSYPNYLKEFDLREFKKLFLIRDPRDILVSHYFSQKFSHEIPSGVLGSNLRSRRSALGSQTIDEYAINYSQELKTKFNKYESGIFDENLKLYRYEDIVFDKENWIADILAFLNLDLRQEKITNIANRFNKLPNTEDPTQHIRKVTPGDHKEKLARETILHLNQIFEEILTKYNYEFEP